jgi:hypothetical protein
VQGAAGQTLPTGVPVEVVFEPAATARQ